MSDDKLDYCPECGSDDLDIDSCLSMQISAIHCADCEYHFSRKVDEERLSKKWNKLKRKPRLVLLKSFMTEDAIREYYPELF